jgi:hypothetical protein
MDRAALRGAVAPIVARSPVPRFISRPAAISMRGFGLYIGDLNRLLIEDGTSGDNLTR